MGSSRGSAGFRGLSHLTPAGDARMVDVSAKSETAREAVARATLKVKPGHPGRRARGTMAKGDVLGVARTAGIMAAKRTPDLIPLCHPLRITGVDITFALDGRASTITVEARVRTVDKTGVEMEALTAAGGGEPHRLRHGQGGGERRHHHQPPPDREVRRQVRAVEAGGRGD